MFYGAIVTLIPKPFKDQQRKTYRQISPMNTDAKVLKPTPKTHKKDYQRGSCGLHLRDEGIVQQRKIHQSSPQYKKGKKIKHMFILLDAQKNNKKIQHSFTIKV